LGTSPDHYWVQQLKGKLAECHLTSPLMQGMCLAVVAVAAAGAVAAAAVVAEENKTNTITVKPLIHVTITLQTATLSSESGTSLNTFLKVLFCGFF